MIFPAKNFLEVLNRKLWEFVTTSQGEDDTLDVHCSFDFDEVQKTFDMIDEGSWDNKPVVHLELLDSPETATYATQSTEQGVRGVTLPYALFVVINNTYDPSVSRKRALNKVVSDVKFKFDRYPIDGVKGLTLNHGEGYLSNEKDNLYANRQSLQFDVYKEV